MCSRSWRAGSDQTICRSGLFFGIRPLRENVSVGGDVPAGDRALAFPERLDQSQLVGGRLQMLVFADREHYGDASAMAREDYGPARLRDVVYDLAGLALEVRDRANL